MFRRSLRSPFPLSEDAGRFLRGRGPSDPCPKTRTFLAAGTRRLAPDRSRDRRTSRASTEAAEAAPRSLPSQRTGVCWSGYEHGYASFDISITGMDDSIDISAEALPPQTSPEG